MNRVGLDSDADDPAASEESWLRPVWEDDTDLDAPPLRRAVRPPSLPAAARSLATETLLGPLATAAAALARLDGQAETASSVVRQGLITRLAYAEAAGWLASQGITARPVSLALRAGERSGRREFWLQHQALRPRYAASTPESDDAWLAADETITRGLALARLLGQLPVGDNPLLECARAEAWLAPLAPASCPFDRGRFERWRDAHGPGARWPDPRPALLRAAEAVRAWMESGIADIPDAIQALAVAALLLKRVGTVEVIPLPLWAAWPGLCAPDDPGVLPRLRGDTAARLAPGGAVWPVVFLHLVAEAARAGGRILAALGQAEAAGAALAAQQDKRSHLGAAIEALLRQPALTASALARHLGITPQAALRLCARLNNAGLVREVTGRGSFKAYSLAGVRSLSVTRNRQSCAWASGSFDVPTVAQSA